MREGVSVPWMAGLKLEEIPRAHEPRHAFVNQPELDAVPHLPPSTSTGVFRVFETVILFL